MTARIPAVRTGTTLRSLRDAGYTLAAALAEVVDNSVEANANNIRIRLDESTNKQGKKHIHRIAVSDDGMGMDGQEDGVLHHYPQLGFSTRYMSLTTIGKYGVGATLAALNYAERIDVWSRTAAKDGWMHVCFDLEEAEADEAAGHDGGIDLPEPAPVPEDLADLLPNGPGTLVVWSKIDRLEAGRFAEDANSLRVEVEKELSRMFRYFLAGGINIVVNDTTLLAHDPLFLMESTWADRSLKKHYKRKDVDPKFEVADHYGATVVADEQVRFAGHEVRLRVTVYPKEVLRRRGQGGDSLATELRVPDNQGALSFVRLDREINYTNVPKILPQGVQDADRFIGIEVSFAPGLDDYMGVRNVKRGVEPHGDLRAALRKRLEKWIPQARGMIQDAWGSAPSESAENAARGEHSTILDEVAKADRTLPKSRVEAPDAEEQERILDKLAKDTKHVDEDSKAKYLDRIKDLPYVVETVDFPGSGFIDITHLSGQIIIRLNERHPFYQDLWVPIREISTAPAGSVSGDEATATARRTLTALTLLVIAYAKAESMDADPSRFGELRDDWGKFLKSLMSKVKDGI